MSTGSRFFLLNVHLQPRISADDMLRAARRFGYAAIGISTIVNGGGSIAPASDNPAIYTGIEIVTTSVSDLRQKLRRYWSKVPMVVVQGGEERINMAAVKDHRVDILSNPCGEKWDRGELKPQMLKYAAMNGVAIEFNLSVIIESRRGKRARILRRLAENLELMRKYRAMPLLTTNTRSIYDLRAPREMIALASLCGMERGDAIRALSEIPAGILTRRWKRGMEAEQL